MQHRRRQAIFQAAKRAFKGSKASSSPVEPRSAH